MTGTGQVQRFVYKELKAGDLRKFEAASADSGTGGGARDQRFSPGGTFAPVFSKIFPSATPRQRTEWGGKKKVSNVHAADVFVYFFRILTLFRLLDVGMTQQMEVQG